MESIQLPSNTAELVQTMTRIGFNTARTVMEAYVQDEEFPHKICANAGIAVELLTKACLLEKSPVLLLDSRPSDLALKSAAGLRAFGPSIDFPTVAASETMRRMLWVWPDFPYRDASDGAVLRNRNAAVHSGIVSQQQATESARIMVKIVQWVFDGPHRERTKVRTKFAWDFWHDYSDAVARLTDLNQDAAAVRLSGKLADARSRFRGRYEEIPEVQLNNLFHSLTSQRVDGSTEQYRISAGDEREHDEFTIVTTHVKCPACEQTGWLISEIEEIAFDSRETDSDGPAVKRIAHPQDFRCPICALELSGAEVAAAGMGTDLDLGWVDL